jgi:hypothetical protein
MRKWRASALSDAVVILLRLTLTTMLLAACGQEGGTDERAPGHESAIPATLEPPRDPAAVRSITPSSGPPRTEVTLRAGGLPPGMNVEIGFGAANTNFEILGQARADSVGEVGMTVVVPAWAEAGRGYLFVVAPVNQPPRAASDTFRVTPPNPRR